MALRHQPRSDRPAFTLVEMLVAMALILFIMVILSEAFVAGLESFRQLKAIGDMEERLRTAATEIRRDLNADHFEGRRRLSDPSFWNVPVREGFFQIIQATPYSLPPGPDKGYWIEGTDTDGNASFRAIDHRLHFSVKLRGNQLDKFFSTVLPAGSPLNALETVFFNQPVDGRFQDLRPNNNVYSTPWAEVAYFLVPDPAGAAAGTGTQLFSLYRAQLLVIPDNRQLNWPEVTGNVKLKGVPVKDSELDNGNYLNFSCQKDTAKAGSLYFNCPSDLAQRVRALPTAVLQQKQSQITNDPTKAYLAMANRSTLLLNDVISFQIQVLLNQGAPASGTAANPDFTDLEQASTATGSNFDTGDPAALKLGILAIQVTLRVWDSKTEQARQITIVQDM